MRELLREVSVRCAGPIGPALCTPLAAVRWIEEQGIVTDYVAEHVLALYLDGRSKLVGWRLVGKGSPTGCPVPAPIVLQGMLLCNASQLVLAHNHPSGDVRPSRDDDAMTSRIAAAVWVSGVGVMLDHVVWAPGQGFYSYHEQAPEALEGEKWIAKLVGR